MYQIDRNGLNGIIENSEFSTDVMLNEKVRSLLCQTINKLCDYNEQTMRQIENQGMSTDSSQTIGEIACALVSQNDAGNCIGLSEMNVLLPNENIVFIDKDYEELRKVVGDKDSDRRYEGFYTANGGQHAFQYKIKFCDKYVKLENLIFNLADYYKVDNPVVYSPFSKKAFQIIYMNDIPENVDFIDFQLEKYDLETIENVNVFWNLNIIKLEQVTCIEKKPYGNCIKYLFLIEKSREGNYYFVLPEHNQAIVYDVNFSDRGTEIWTNHECEDFTLVQWKSVDWNMPEIKKLQANGKIFSNKLESSRFPSKKMISMCDIEHAIYPFRNNMGIECELTKHLDKIFLRYSAKYRCSMINRIYYKTLKRVMVRFDGNAEYMNDYANYALQYLEYYYPEIEWVGGQ